VLHIKAGQKLSLQYHQHKDETVMVWAGRMTSSTIATVRRRNFSR